MPLALSTAAATVSEEHDQEVEQLRVRVTEASIATACHAGDGARRREERLAAQAAAYIVNTGLDAA
ncbi:hypothetical protein [Streptomyces sp. NPDC127098]|uniref:hypothetical protein n=1 Tax=Streptomyces sp. NPDC127098 TaxID=3347137 RepID=UPI0036637980